MTKIKFCGLKSLDDIYAVNNQAEKFRNALSKLDELRG